MGPARLPHMTSSPNCVRAMPARCLAGLLLHALLVAPVRAATPLPTPLPADVNCDGASSAADFTAAVLVSVDGSRFAECASADPFRDRPLSAADFLSLLQGLFDTLSARWTPTPSASPTTTRSPTLTATPS